MSQPRRFAILGAILLLPAIMLPAQQAGSAQPNAGLPQPPAGQPLRLSVAEAEQIAIRNNPNLSVARLAAMVGREVYRENRSALLPFASANLTAVDTNNGNRISAGALNNPVIYERAAYGSTVQQLITDFGHTNNIVAGTRFHAEAEKQNAVASANQIKLAVDRNFYNAISAYAVLNVARQTVQSRQLLADQVTVLEQNKLKSSLDVSFANTNLEQAQLLLLDAENQYDSTLAMLSEVLGYTEPPAFELVDDVGQPPTPAPALEGLVSEAYAQRPELQAQQFQLRAARSLQSAAWEQALPSIRAIGTVGQAPVRDPHITSWYGAVGINVEIPIFTGLRIQAQSHEAKLNTQAEDERLVGLRNAIGRDVRTSWLAANTAFRRLSVTAALLEQTRLALELAQTRYKLGLGSIVEVSQAQLAETTAEIDNARARYDYLLAQAVIRFETGSL